MNISMDMADIGRLKADGRMLLSRFWAWWSGEIAAATPAYVRRYFGSSDSHLLVAQQNDRISVVLVSASERRQLGDFDRDTVQGTELENLRASIDAIRSSFGREVLELPRGRVLRRILSLPAGTEERLEQVLGFEMDRFTPFAREQVYFDYRVVERDSSAGTIRVELTLTLRNYLDQLLEQLEACGIRPTTVRVARKFAAPESENGRADLLPASRRPRRRLHERMLPWVLGVIIVVLAVAAIALPIVRQGAVLGDLRRQIELVRSDATAAAKTRDDIVSVAGQADFFAARRSAAPTMVHVLDELTRLVPDDTWVSRLEVVNHQVRLHGESESASSLIAMVEASAMLHNARFASPVTKNPRTGNDRFVIEADLPSNAGETP